MRERALSLLMRPTSPPPVFGIVVPAALIAADTFVVYPLATARERDREAIGSGIER